MKSVGIVGTGVIGRGWALAFARAGYRALMYDAREGAAQAAVHALMPAVDALAEEDDIDSAAEVAERLHPVTTLREALSGVEYVQESILEEVPAKEAVFREMDAIAAPDVILASSASALPPSDFLEAVPGRERCIVAHPFNPPYLMPLVELVPSRWTSTATIERTKALQSAIGQVPVVVHGEVRGYVGNRLQAAVINEAIHLVGESVISPADLDKTLRWALGLRWALMGPFEGMDFNAPGGIEEYIEKFGASYQDLGEDLQVAAPWRKEAIDACIASRRAEVPVSGLPDRAAQRDRLLVRLRRLLQD